jgi:hypothetical protein
MNRMPEKIDLFEKGELKLTLDHSEGESLNHKGSYTGRASRARIHGPRFSLVTFYDDQLFRDGENHVTIEKRVDEPIHVPLASNFVGSGDEEGEKAYLGQTPQYNFIFFRKRKLEWWESLVRDLPGGKFAFDTIKNLLNGSDDPRVQGTIKVVGALFKPPDGNYSVDNCSSVKFGA